MGLYDASGPIHVDCIRFCFMNILRKELHQVAELWNQHIISSSKFGNSSGPRGRPDCMYSLPHLYSTSDYKVDIDQHEVDQFIDNTTMALDDYSTDFKEFASIIMDEYQLHQINNAREGFDLYIKRIKEVEKVT
jgi:hypothetical protein